MGSNVVLGLTDLRYIDKKKSKYFFCVLQQLNYPFKSTPNTLSEIDLVKHSTVRL